MAQLGVSEAQWEQIALETLAEWEWRPLPGTAIAPGTEDGRPSWGDVILPGRMLAAMRRLNPQVPAEYLDQAVAAIVQPTSQDPVAENYRLHQICVQVTGESATSTPTAWSRTRRSGWSATGSSTTRGSRSTR